MSNVKYYHSPKLYNLKEMFDETCRAHASRPVFHQKVDGSYTEITYEQYHNDVCALGTELLSMGLNGKRIIVLGENCYSWCLTYMTTVCGLGTIVPVDKEIPAEEISNIAKISEASAIIYSDKYEDKISPIRKKLLKIPFSRLPELLEAGYAKIEEGNEEYSNLSVDVDVLCSLIFTSGTTGVSKGVMLSQRNICFNLENIRKVIKVTPSDIALSILPLHHVYECSAGFLFPIYCGASVAFSEGVRHIMKNMKEIRPTKMLCVPMLLETVYNKIWANIRKKGIENKVKTIIALTNKIQPASARIAAKKRVFAEIHESMGGRIDLLVSGGAPIDAKIMKGLADFGFHVIQGYGLTECAPLAAVNPDYFSKDNSAGRVLPGGQLKIIDEAEDGTGEICYRGDNVMMGYLNRPDLTAEVKKNGWLHTGDLGYIDSDGFLIITGRKKNVIVTAGGKNVFPEELETYLSRSPYVNECVVVGIMNDKKKDYDIIAIVCPNYTRAEELLGKDYTTVQLSAALKEAMDEVNSTVQSYKRIDMVIIRETEFPKNSSRKIKRMGLADSIMDEYLNLRK